MCHLHFQNEHVCSHLCRIAGGCTTLTVQSPRTGPGSRVTPTVPTRCNSCIHTSNHIAIRTGNMQITRAGGVLVGPRRGPELARAVLCPLLLVVLPSPAGPTSVHMQVVASISIIRTSPCMSNMSIQVAHLICVKLVQGSRLQLHGKQSSICVAQAAKGIEIQGIPSCACRMDTGINGRCEPPLLP